MSGGHHPDVGGIHFPDHHGDETLEPEAPDQVPLTWQLDNVELLTVGVDIGSSTSHLLFSRLHLQRLAQSLSSRFVVVRRETLHRSSILLTPFTEGDRIDAAALGEFVDRCYREAGVSPDQVDTGAVILTGVALDRVNARAVADLFAGAGGRFVCASAGHNLEAILSAHGSGAVALSRARPGRRLHVDIGGGTSKLSLLEGGEILETATLAVGGRLIVFDAGGRVERLEVGAAAVAEDLGWTIKLGDELASGSRRLLAQRMADILVAALSGEPPDDLGRRLQLTQPLQAQGVEARPITCSGGVSEYIYRRETATFNDLAAELAETFREACAPHGLTIEELPAGEGIRATAVGASQFTVQLSGNTVHISDPGLLPLRNLPVVRPRLPAGVPEEESVAEAIRLAMSRLDLSQIEGPPVAISLPWSGEPRYAHLRALAGGIVRGLSASLDAGRPLVLALEADLARSLGAILTKELKVVADIVCIDGVELMELDYVDIGQPVQPANVVPVVVKSLAFSASPAKSGPHARGARAGAPS